MRKTVLPLTQDTNRLTGSELDSLWDANAEKYKCCCRSLHVNRASLYIAYAQMLIIFVFSAFFLIYYLQAINGHLPADNWVNQLGDRYISSLVFAITLQLVLVLLLIHGICTERRSFLVPFIVFASIAVFFGVVQLVLDMFGLIRYPVDDSNYQENQLFSHLVGVLVHTWCVSIVWRCYAFFGDKKIARQIGEQLSTTHVAFHYGDIPYGYVAMPQPPAYADTVFTDNKQPLDTA